ncbi:hypothetical protein [Paraburkholderia unamae]|uniref:hypothetical protein n=1 Tax=Paraburkholderia unamae TaxID=219649 RepID=UPI001057E309|nr:hypothetical protein [Paraburkholderia unamae]
MFPAKRRHLAAGAIHLFGELIMEFQLLNAVLHGERLNEPLTWVYIAAIVAVAIAGWKFGGLAHDACHAKDDE